MKVIEKAKMLLHNEFLEAQVFFNVQFGPQGMNFEAGSLHKYWAEKLNNFFCYSHENILVTELRNYNFDCNCRETSITE